MAAPKLLPLDKRHQRCRLTDNDTEIENGIGVGEDCIPIDEACPPKYDYRGLHHLEMRRKVSLKTDIVKEQLKACSDLQHFIYL
jgi:hypothetical protein